MKRFYKNVSYEADDSGDAFVVTLDDMPIKTPAKKILTLPNVAFAKAVKQEWANQNENIQPNSMPLMRLACTVIDYAKERSKNYKIEALRYASTDTICYRSNTPDQLAQLQKDIWDPILIFMKDFFKVKLLTTTGASPIKQPTFSIKTLTKVLDSYDAWILTGVINVIRASGSTCIGLSLYEGHLNASTAFHAAELETTWQNERWGVDSETVVRLATIRKEYENAVMFFNLVS